MYCTRHQHCGLDVVRKYKRSYIINNKYMSGYSASLDKRPKCSITDNEACRGVMYENDVIGKIIGFLSCGQEWVYSVGW